MLTKLNQKFFIQPILEQVKSLSNFKRLELNGQTGEFFSDPWVVKSEFKNTPLGEVLESLGDIGQARLLCLESAESYTAHADPDDRIHLSIVTNPYSFLVDISNNQLYHLPADGQLWYMDTSKIHVAANWGARSRIHLNVRILLPKYNESKPTICIKVIEGDYDWKQLAYTPLMQVINKNIKLGHITGYKGISEKEIWVNTDTPELFDNAFQEIETAGVQLVKSSR
jgi:hypothetical protein